MSTLFWALFALPDLEVIDIKAIEHTFTEFIGHMLYMAYYILAIVVMLNVVIATMSTTYTKIEVICYIYLQFGVFIYFSL